MNSLVEKQYAVLALRVLRHARKEKGIEHFLRCVGEIRDMHGNWHNWPKKSRRHEVAYWLEVW